MARRQWLPVPDHQCSPSCYWLSWWQKSGAGITAQQEVNAAAALHEAEPVPIESDPIQEEQADLQSMFSDAACANVPDDEVDSPDSS